MKKLFTITLSVMLGIAFVGFNQGCTGKKTIKKKFNAVYQVEFTVNESNNVAYDKEAFMDLVATNADFGKNKNDIIDFNVDSIKYYVYDLIGDDDLDDKIVNASLKVASEDHSQEFTIGEINDLNLFSNYDEGNARKLTVDNNGIDKFITIMTNDPFKGWIRFTGTMEEVPTNFKMRVKVYVTFNAWIL